MPFLCSHSWPSMTCTQEMLPVRKDMMSQLINPTTSLSASQGMQGVDKVWTKACKTHLTPRIW